jgi:hypothetical protein
MIGHCDWQLRSDSLDPLESAMRELSILFTGDFREQEFRVAQDRLKDCLIHGVTLRRNLWTTPGLLLQEDFPKFADDERAAFPANPSVTHATFGARNVIGDSSRDQGFQTGFTLRCTHD